VPVNRPMLKDQVVRPGDDPGTPYSVHFRLELAGVNGERIVGYVVDDDITIDGVFRPEPDEDGVVHAAVWPTDKISPAGSRWKWTRVIDGHRTIEALIVPDDAAEHWVQDLLDEFPDSLPSSALQAETERAMGVEEGLQAAIDAVEAGDVDSVNGRSGVVVGLAEAADLVGEALLARNADNLTSGTVDDARIPATIARDAEVTDAIAAAIAALVDSSPGTLDTLNELAAALGDDPNFAATIAASIGAKQAGDPTLTALAAADWVANSIPLGTGADAVAQLALGVNTFPARSSAGNVAAKIITDYGLFFVQQIDAPAMRSAIGAAALAVAQIFTAAQQIRPTASGAIGLQVRASTTAPGDTQQWQDAAGVVQTRITGATMQNAGGTSFIDWSRVQALFQGNGTATTLTVKSAAGTQTVDMLAVTSNANAVLSRFNKEGYFMTRKVAAPADADLANGELAVWLDATPGATLAMFRAKDSGGTVRSGSLALA